MTDQQKQAMAEGRVKAAMARRDAENVIPADLPPGADRDEAVAMVADHNAEKIEENMRRDEIEGLDKDKFNQRDNEILRHVTDEGVPVTGAKPGYRLAWLKIADSTLSSGGLAAVRRMLADAKHEGYQPVAGAEAADDFPDGGTGTG